MTSQTGTNHHFWRRAALGALAVGLMAGFAAPTALAQPSPTPVTDAPADGTEAPAAPAMTADQALAIIATEYDTGAGGGQLSNLIHDVMTLRAQGFMPSKGNRTAIQEALEKRPNQAPLVEALKATLNFQLTQKSRQAAAGVPQSGFNAGLGQLPPGMSPDPTNPNNSGVLLAPGGGVTQPIG
jgi:hypothetical protein